MVKLSAALAAVGFLTVVAFRTEVLEQDVLETGSDDISQWNFADVVLNPEPDSFLIADLVPPPGHIFEVHSRMPMEGETLLHSNGSYLNETHWAFININNTGTVTPTDQWFAAVPLSFWQSTFGVRRSMVTNTAGDPLFAIEMSKYTWNPTRLSWSFRIRHGVTDEILYTINKDWFGSGFLFIRDEWRIYRGRRRDGNQIYYVAGGYFGYDHEFYHSKTEFLEGREPIAVAAFPQGMYAVIDEPDVFSLKVHENEDTALLLAATVIIDKVHDNELMARVRERRIALGLHNGGMLATRAQTAWNVLQGRPITGTNNNPYGMIRGRNGWTSIESGSLLQEKDSDDASTWSDKAMLEFDEAVHNLLMQDGSYESVWSEEAMAEAEKESWRRKGTR